MKEINLVWKLDTKELYDSNWQAFKSANRLPPLAIDYIKKSGFLVRFTLRITLSTSTCMLIIFQVSVVRVRTPSLKHS